MCLAWERDFHGNNTNYPFFVIKVYFPSRSVIKVSQIIITVSVQHEYICSGHYRRKNKWRQQTLSSRFFVASSQSRRKYTDNLSFQWSIFTNSLLGNIKQNKIAFTWKYLNWYACLKLGNSAFFSHSYSVDLKRTCIFFVVTYSWKKLIHNYQRI